MTLQPFVVGGDGEGALDELRCLGLVLQRVATQQRICDKLIAGGHASQVQPFPSRKAVGKGLAQAASSKQQAGERRGRRAVSTPTRRGLTVAERVDVLSIHLQRRLVHLLGRLVLAMHCLQKRAIVAKGVDLCTRMRARASIEHAARSSRMPCDRHSQSTTHAARDSQLPACSGILQVQEHGRAHVLGVRVEGALIHALRTLEIASSVLQEEACHAQQARVNRIQA